MEISAGKEGTKAPLSEYCGVSSHAQVCANQGFEKSCQLLGTNE